MKIDKFLVVLLAFIVILSLAVYLNFKNFSGSIHQIKAPSFSLPEGSFPFLEKEAGKDKMTFTSEDGRFRVEYDSGWTPLEESFLQSLNSNAVDKDAKNLFFAQKTSLKNFNLSFLLIQELVLEKKYNSDEFLEKIKNAAAVTSTEIEIIKWEPGDNICLLEAKYQAQNKPAIHEKEKIFLLENKAYLVVLFAFDEVWQNIENEADEILNSAQLVR